MGLFAKKVCYLLLYIAGLSPAFASTSIVPLFTANYTLHHNQLEIGRVKLSIITLGNHRYQLTSATRSSGLLSFIKHHTLLESSLFELKDKHIRPLSYQYLKQSSSHKKEVNLRFDWKKLKVINSSDGDHWSMPISHGVLDKALLQIALMRDLSAANSKLSYQVADGGKLKQYTFSTQGTEPLNVDGKRYQTIKLARTKDQHESITYYWCAPALANIPVLLQREKKYGLFEMRLQNISFQH